MAFFCSNCGTKINEGENFCSNCGSNINSINYETNDKIEYQEIKEKYEDDNICAIFGFIFSLLPIPFVGIVLSIIGLISVKKKTKKRIGFVVAGMILSSLRLLVFLSLLFLLFAFEFFI